MSEPGQHVRPVIERWVNGPVPEKLADLLAGSDQILDYIESRPVAASDRAARSTGSAEIEANLAAIDRQLDINDRLLAELLGDRSASGSKGGVGAYSLPLGARVEECMIGIDEKPGQSDAEPADEELAGAFYLLHDEALLQGMDAFSDMVEANLPRWNALIDDIDRNLAKMASLGPLTSTVKE